MDIYSFSRLESFNQCEWQYYLTYILKKRGKQNIYGEQGGNFHELAERLQKGELNNNQALEIFDDILLKHSMGKLKFINDKVEDNYFNNLHNYIKYFKKFEGIKFEIEYHILDHIGTPKEWIFKDVDGSTYSCISPALFQGYVDLVVYHNDNEISIIDFKTSSIYSKNDRIKYGRQLIIYALFKQKEGYKIKSIGWDFMKYCRASWNGGKSKRVQRKDLISEYKTSFFDALVEYGMNEIEAQLLIEKAIEKNDLDLIPEDVRNLLRFEREVVEHEFSESTIKETMDYINNTISKIESKTKLELDWKCRSITKTDNFYCSNLCGHGNCESCPAYKKFVNSEKDNFNKKEDDLDDLFLSLLG